jgi:hypothetical protein
VRDLFRISAEVKASSPVFIVGEARSGTSILYRTLQKHPSFRPRTPSLVETEIFAHLRRTFMFAPGYPEPLVRFMLDDADEYARFLSTIRLPKLVSALLAPANLMLRERSRALWFANLSHLVVRSYFFHARRARGCARLVEKTPTNTQHLGPLTACFPRARLLYIHRHPVDVFGSYRRRAVADPDAAWAALDVEAFCRAFETSTSRALAWRDRHDNLMMLSYRDFTSTPEHAFAQVCGFLGEPADPAAVREGRPEPGRWAGDPHLWAEIVPVTKDWRDHVSPDEVSIVQYRLGRLMTALGYARYDESEARL